ncbi:putative Trans-1,2-dihydrobenzene-1,2-diol dehydrogenase [Amylocarpus encephaloides]|uniref:D-xylose 1-dehydrogenase (NADP(+), D-xylono-1,5-lactone-forming) n=1 Tax=Amylocarpus encephaloides TaxID=45428 RepID=A0A9P8C682_9HELO|nr:putative Trans-1,2-dihydrobenzene-1,2-diol dehydrogenase [Amylocarpus encephaloides]
MAPHNVRWGIMATGGIATTFAKDILCDPSTRDVSDIAHTIVAAASSSSQSRAQEFLDAIKIPNKDAKAYGSYHELVKDQNIDIVYVATPHSHHFQNAMLCLEAGKNVLCEKAFTVNAEQTRRLVKKAKEKNLFLMEAVWTRYFPLSIKIREMITDGKIGEVLRVSADLSCNCNKPDSDSLNFGSDGDKSRMVNMDLAGGALLDLGIYSLTWVFQILYLTQKLEKREKPKVLAAVDKYHTGADEMTSIICHFEKNRTMGVATTGLRLATQPDGEGSAATGPACRIQGTKGEIQVIGPLYRPTEYRVIMNRGPKGQVEDVICPIPKDTNREGKEGENGWGHGMFWEADEAGRCLRDGKKQSDTISWEESITIMEVMDEVRKQGGVVYPELIDSTTYDEKSPLNGKA